MKKLFFTLVCVFLYLAASGQQKDPEVERLVHENLLRTGIVLNPYEYLPVAETPVPAGYKAFYISHYGRHGSRSDWPADGYRGVTGKFTRAHEAGILTPQGERAYEMIKDIFARYDDMGGRLTPRGAREHRQIAHRMYNKYKKVFRSGNRRIRAISSTSPRCIISMAAFTGELLSLDRKLDIGWDTGERYMRYMSSGETPEIREMTAPVIRQNREAHPRDTATFLSRVFTDIDKGLEIAGPADDFLEETLMIAVASGAFDCDDSLLRLFNEDDIYWHEANFAMTMYLRQCNSVDYGDLRMAIPEVQAFLDDFTAKADEVIADGNYVADLRFGHDTHLLAICARLGIKGVGERLTAEQSLAWPGFLYSPFAGNLQAVFYRGKAGDVLVKFYLNEREATLLGLDGGPYYKWEDVKDMLAKGPTGRASDADNALRLISLCCRRR